LLSIRQFRAEAGIPFLLEVSETCLQLAEKV
jgi:hypothetical protein